MTENAIDFDDRVSQTLDRLCKPPGSLGELETVARRLCHLQRTVRPRTRPRRAVVFAADHGVTVEGVTAWPRHITRAVVDIMRQGRTASGVFARSLGCDYEVVDVGLNKALPDGGSLVQGSVRHGTGNIRIEPAMSEDDFARAWQIGVDRAIAADDVGDKLVIGGEMGIGNTTAASCLVCLLGDTRVAESVGHGAGINDEGLARKRRVVDDALARVRNLESTSVKRQVREVAGLEIIALAGFYAEAARRRLTILLDGFIATAAAMVAESIHPGTRQQMIAGHRSTEPGHVAALRILQLEPVLDLKMRLGEATGALAALPTLDLAAAMIGEMATLDDLEIQ